MIDQRSIGLAARPTASVVIAELSLVRRLSSSWHANRAGKLLTDMEGVEFTFEFNSVAQEPPDSGEWRDLGAPRRREAMGMHDLITEWE